MAGSPAQPTPYLQRSCPWQAASLGLSVPVHVLDVKIVYRIGHHVPILVDQAQLEPRLTKARDRIVPNALLRVHHKVWTMFFG